MSFWQNKKVLLTGHTGFKGSWLSLWLQHLQAKVIGFSLAPATTPNLFTIAEVAKEMTSVIGDIRDFQQIQKVINEHRPDIIIHMAAQALVRYSYQNPLETYATNVMGTANLLEAARLSDCAKVIVNVTTDKCYENNEWPWGYRENDRLGGHDPYSNSKACAELVTAAYRQSYFEKAKNAVGIATARAGNVIGGGDWSEDRLIPDIIRSQLNQLPLVIRNPAACRPWQHVLEPLSGYLLLAQHLYNNPSIYSEAWNFGPNEDDVKPVSWLVKHINKLWNNTLHWEHDNAQHPHEAGYLKLDCAKAKAKLNWQPHWNLEKGLKETVKWYQAYQQKQNMRSVTLMQLDDFINQPAHKTVMLP